MKPAAILLALVAVIAFIAWRIIRSPDMAAPPQIRTVATLYEGTRQAYESGLTPADILGTGSMRPYIPAHPAGETIVVAMAGIDATPYRDLRTGDFVSYRARSGRDLLHRLGEKSDAGFVVYGTANASSDPERVTAKNYIGRVAVVYRLP